MTEGERGKEERPSDFSWRAGTGCFYRDFIEICEKFTTIPSLCIPIRSTDLKVTSLIPENYLPSLATSCENLASHCEQIMEKTQKFQIVYAGPTNLHCHRHDLSNMLNYKHHFCIRFITEQVKLISFT